MSPGLVRGLGLLRCVLGMLVPELLHLDQAAVRAEPLLGIITDQVKRVYRFVAVFENMFDFVAGMPLRWNSAGISNELPYLSGPQQLPKLGIFARSLL